MVPTVDLLESNSRGVREKGPKHAIIHLPKPRVAYEPTDLRTVCNPDRLSHHDVNSSPWYWGAVWELSFLVKISRKTSLKTHT